MTPTEQWVVGLLPLMRREARSMGIADEHADDAVQAAALNLLTRGMESARIATSGVVCRRAIIDGYMRTSQSVASGDEALEGDAVGVPSHEDDVVTTVSAQQVAELMPPPARARKNGPWARAIKQRIKRENA